MGHFAYTIFAFFSSLFSFFFLFFSSLLSILVDITVWRGLFWVDDTIPWVGVF